MHIIIIIIIIIILFRPVVQNSSYKISTSKDSRREQHKQDSTCEIVAEGHVFDFLSALILSMLFLRLFLAAKQLSLV